jgi:hypothetical protein
MLSLEDLKSLRNKNSKIFGSDGEKIGTLGHIYVDARGGVPEVITVHAGLFGTAENFVPLTKAEISNGQLYVKFPKNFVLEAPNIDPAGELCKEDEELLFRYYAHAGVGSLRVSGDRPSPSPRLIQAD